MNLLQKVKHVNVNEHINRQNTAVSWSETIYKYSESDYRIEDYKVSLYGMKSKSRGFKFTEY